MDVHAAAECFECPSEGGRGGGGTGRASHWEGGRRERWARWSRLRLGASAVEGRGRRETRSALKEKARARGPGDRGAEEGRDQGRRWLGAIEGGSSLRRGGGK
eukprot:3940948-Rhodomonas_salina.5